MRLPPLRYSKRPPQFVRRERSEPNVGGIGKRHKASRVTPVTCVTPPPIKKSPPHPLKKLPPPIRPLKGAHMPPLMSWPKFSTRNTPQPSSSIASVFGSPSLPSRQRSSPPNSLAGRTRTRPPTRCSPTAGRGSNRNGWKAAPSRRLPRHHESPMPSTPTSR